MKIILLLFFPIFLFSSTLAYKTSYYEDAKSLKFEEIKQQNFTYFQTKSLFKGYNFNDIWIKAYSKQRVKQSWGNILKAIKNVPLLGGSNSSGEELYEEATQEIEKLELELIEKYEHPPMFYWG